MPLSPHDIPDREVHCLCVRCHKWHWPDEVRPFALPRHRPFGLQTARVIAGIDEPVRFMCHACYRRRFLLRAWGLGILAVLIGGAIVFKLLGVA
jgi:hypothetical protein